MNFSDQERPAPLRCPTPSDALAAVLALLPVGRAWQSHEGGPMIGLAGGFEATGSFQPDAFQTRKRTQSVLMGFWRAYAEMVSYVNSRLCDLRLEFWCATHKETHDLWMVEYGLPDACDPFPDLCTKVAALGGTRCEYYAAVAARAGWSIDCLMVRNDCGTPVGNFQIGCSSIGGSISGARLLIKVFLNESQAYAAPIRRQPLMGNFAMGQPLTCGPDISPLKCILERIVHAHIEISYETEG